VLAEDTRKLKPLMTCGSALRSRRELHYPHSKYPNREAVSRLKKAAKKAAHYVEFSRGSQQPFEQGTPYERRRKRIYFLIGLWSAMIGAWSVSDGAAVRRGDAADTRSV
jgi:endonuclease YncB( thermonuclease family)